MKLCQMLVTTKKNTDVSLLGKRRWTCEERCSAKGTGSHSTIYVIILHIMYFINVYRVVSSHCYDCYQYLENPCVKRSVF